MKECGLDSPNRPGRLPAIRDPKVEMHNCPACSYATVYRHNLKKHIDCKHPDFQYLVEKADV